MFLCLNVNAFVFNVWGKGWVGLSCASSGVVRLFGVAGVLSEQLSGRVPEAS